MSSPVLQLKISHYFFYLLLCFKKLCHLKQFQCQKILNCFNSFNFKKLLSILDFLLINTTLQINIVFQKPDAIRQHLFDLK
ncbi:hypothetical protein DRI50_04390 [candidate division KSB1 bacterium]|nr:MAG: hypothetical protein DRI50_04390 [candidate division KSB1 bacterium]